MATNGLSLLKLTFLGTSAAMPTVNRNVSGLAVKADGDLLLFDCGEGSQRQMIKFGTGFNVSAVFFTHFHLDHYLGIVGFLRTLGMGGREEPMTLYGPLGGKRLLDTALHLGVEKLAFPVNVVELKGGETFQRDGYSVKAVRVEHRVYALGYVLQEDLKPGRFDPDTARTLGVKAGPDFGRLQKGESVTAMDGTLVKPEQVMGPARAGRKLAISGDTRPCAALIAAAQDADLLVHEATFIDEEQERAIETQHSTAREAGRVAREAKVKRLVLTHLSSRHDVDTRPIFEHARAEFSGPVDVAHDGFTFELSSPP